jgi:hypothetical protein
MISAFESLSANKPGVPHISLVFREMCDTTALNQQLSTLKRNLRKGQTQALPPAILNRSWGAPTFAFFAKGGIPLLSTSNLSTLKRNQEGRLSKP